MLPPVTRRRRLSDLPECIGVLRAVHEVDAYPLNWPAEPHRWLTPPRLLHAWIAEDPGGAVIGHVAVRGLPDVSNRPRQPGRAELSLLFVAPAARRRATASALVRCAQSWAVDHGYGLNLNVADEPRSAAIDFYEATGWRHVATTDADWTTAEGRPVKLRHYAWEPTWPVSP